MVALSTKPQLWSTALILGIKVTQVCDFHTGMTWKGVCANLRHLVYEGLKKFL